MGGVHARNVPSAEASSAAFSLESDDAETSREVLRRAMLLK